MAGREEHTRQRRGQDRHAGAEPDPRPVAVVGHGCRLRRRGDLVLPRPGERGVAGEAERRLAISFCRSAAISAEVAAAPPPPLSPSAASSTALAGPASRACDRCEQRGRQEHSLRRFVHLPSPSRPFDHASRLRGRAARRHRARHSMCKPCDRCSGSCSPGSAGRRSRRSLARAPEHVPTRGGRLPPPRPGGCGAPGREGPLRHPHHGSVRRRGGTGDLRPR